MKLRTLIVSTLISLAPIAAYADKAPAPTKVEVSKADAERFVAFFNKLIDVIVANADDCTKMAAAMNAHADANAALIKEMNSPENKKKDLPKEYKDKMTVRMQKEMGPALQKKCMQDKGVNAAMEKIAK